MAFTFFYCCCSTPTYIGETESTRKILQIQFVRKILVISRNLPMDTLDSEMVVNEENCCRFERKGTGLLKLCVNNCEGKVTRVLEKCCDIGGDANLHGVSTIHKLMHVYFLPPLSTQDI